MHIVLFFVQFFYFREKANVRILYKSGLNYYPLGDRLLLSYISFS